MRCSKCRDKMLGFQVRNQARYLDFIKDKLHNVSWVVRYLPYHIGCYPLWDGQAAEQVRSTN